MVQLLTKIGISSIMKIEHILKRTSQLTEIEKSQFIELRSKTFSGTMTAVQFDTKYTQTPIGYSYHGLMIADDSIVGACNMIPCSYNYFGRRVMFCLSVDTMIHEQYRGNYFGLLKTTNLVINAMRQDGISFTFGFPNNKSHGIMRRMLRWRDIGELDLYVLPLKIGSVYRKLKCLNMMSHALTAMLVRVPSLGRADVCSFNIEKVTDDTFRRRRYDSSHQAIKLDDGSEVVYKIINKESGARTLQLIDVCPLTAATFDRGVKSVHRMLGDSVDLLAFVGRLPFRPINMIRIPKALPRSRAKRAYVCGKILNHQIIDDRVFDLSNWNLNYSDNDMP